MNLLNYKQEKKEDFIGQNLESVRIVDLPVDASSRKYSRIYSSSGDSFILMDNPISEIDSMNSFINMSDYLVSRGFCAPEILAKDIDNGFLLLSDLGNVSLKNHFINSSSAKEIESLYFLVIDLLVELQNKDIPNFLQEFNNSKLLDEQDEFIKWYVPYKYKRNLTEDEISQYRSLWFDALNKQVEFKKSVILRDFHTENIMYLKDNISIKKLGLLDFQDALFGSDIYDLVSILEDARYFVPREGVIKYIEYFCTKKMYDFAEVLKNYSILGAQRNSRILGVFARKFLRDGDDRYLRYIPDVEKYLSYDLEHDSLFALSDWFLKLK